MASRFLSRLAPQLRAASALAPRSLPPQVAGGRRRCGPLAALVLLACATGARGEAAPSAAGDLSANPDAANPDAANPDAAYAAKVRPLLRERCFACHGALRQEAGLRLDTVAGMLAGGDSGPALVVGDPAASLLVARVSAAQRAEQMPPEGEGELMDAAQVAQLRSWIAAGAPHPADERPEADPREHWAFRPAERPAPPWREPAAPRGNPIDAFIDREHGRRGLTAQPEAPRSVLIRRAYLDVLGLPPDRQARLRWEHDAGADWYERLVDELLDDPRYGERWARHWMDVWRYSDWWGLGEEHRNSQKHMWHFRDWIVESLNADLPYDEMIRQMLAADELYPEDLSKIRATGMLARNWFKWNRSVWLDDTVEHVAKGLLGLTVNCAKCHDHKYDPIRQEEYYRLRAFFEPLHARLDVTPGEADVQRDAIPRVFDALLEAPTYRFIRGEETKPDRSRSLEPRTPAALPGSDAVIAPLTLPRTAWQPERRHWVADAYRQTAERELAAAGAALAPAAAARDAAAAAAAVRSLAVVSATRLAASAAPAAAIAAPLAASDAPAEALARHEATAAERAWVAARAERTAVELRIAAAQARWAADDFAAATDVVAATETAGREADDQGLAAAAREAARAAARACRATDLARARQRSAEADRNWLRALLGPSSESLDDLEAQRNQTRDAVAQAAQALEQSGEEFPPLVGAQWTATRFGHSGADDPAIAFPPRSSGRRTALATWIADARNPLTARVAVNHLWGRHMGRPLVATVFDFGRRGTPPTHPELLDWLACELAAGPDGGQPWSMKHVHRLILTSAVYRRTSSAAGGAAAAAVDPENRWWWRRDAIRLEAEAIRDGVLATAGLLDARRGGPPVPLADQERSLRRSLYFFHSGIDRNLFLITFDEADAKECYRRDHSIVPQQALAMSNARLVHDAARAIAARLSPAAASDEAFVAAAFAEVLGRGPTAAETAACLPPLAAWRAETADAAAADAAAPRAYLIWALLNHNDFVTLR